jgi:flagellar protein FliO/FliZ
MFVSVCGAQATAPAQAAFGGSSNIATSGLRMVLSLLLVLGILAACAWGMRRWRDRRQHGTGSIEVVSGVTLGSKERVVLLRIANEQVLVGLSPAGMRSLHVIKDSDSITPFRAQLEAVE